MLRILAVVLAVPLHITVASAQCTQSNAIWSAERDGTRFLISGNYGLEYGSHVKIEGWEGQRLAWRSQGDVTCSNGASICTLSVENNREEPDLSISSVVVELVREDNSDVPEWVVLASFGQTMWAGWGLHADWFMEGDEEPIYPPNIYKLASCQSAESVASDTPIGVDNNSSPVWQFRENGIYHVNDNRPPIVLTGSFGRPEIDIFLGNVKSNVLRTEFEDCNQCYYIQFDNGLLFIDSLDAKSIAQLKGYGPLFIDAYGIRGGNQIAKGRVLYCDDGMEEVCLPEPEATVGYVIDRGQCDPVALTQSTSALAKREFSGCEIIAGFSISEW